MINSLCILGGGTSGLVSALMLKRAWPGVDISIVESSKFGIIGVGEGSTEHWRKFINHIGIDVPTLIRETGATFKVGIKFTNWQGDGKHYFHSLSEQHGQFSPENGLPYTWVKMISDNVDPLQTAWKLSQDSLHVEPLHDILAQYHFDTFKLNEFLHTVCCDRGIQIIDTEIDDVILDEQGYVKHLVDKDSDIHAADFFIDCSGFRRVIGSKLDAKWVDCSKQLPMNSAIAFPTGYTEDIPSYTESTALSSGWVWRIPTQERYGNGYVFCDEFINETAAFDEVQDHYANTLGIKEELQVGRRVKFSAGYVEKFWIKNCVMIGLSGIFVEPLEASSIGTTIQQTFLMLPALFSYERGDEKTANTYNGDMREVSTNIIDFIQLHYFTQRDDSEFWRWAKNEISMTDFNREYLEYFKNHSVNSRCFKNDMKLFGQLNYMQVMHGLGLFNSEKIKTMYDAQMSKYNDIINTNFSNDADWEKTLQKFTHRQALDIIKGRNLQPTSIGDIHGIKF